MVTVDLRGTLDSKRLRSDTVSTATNGASRVSSQQTSLYDTDSPERQGDRE